MGARAGSDLKMDGVGRASGGHYHHVDISGVSTVQGDLDCARLRVQGVVKILGSVKAEHTQIQGATTIQGNLSGSMVRLEGAIQIQGGCEADKVVGGGAVGITGLLNAEEVSLTLQGSSHVGEIGAGRIRIMRNKRGRGWSLLRPRDILSVETIEGDDVYLEDTKAHVVRGNTVVIGPGCQIDLLEYRTTLEKHPDASIGEERRQA
jgi:cytoskeletal protein CcmA (bactofilin family)